MNNQSPGQSNLQARITELIERHKILDQQPGHSTSERLMDGFIRHIWPEIRDDYRQMTQYLEEELKKALKERHIDAEVSSRIKGDTSIMKTLERREKCLLEHGGTGFNSYHDIIREMHDLSGLRIVLGTREHCNTAHKMIEDLYEQQKPPAYFDPNREVGQHWKQPWFGAYETRNYRVQLAHDNRANLGASHQYSGVMFEIQLTSFSDNLYNKLAHTLLYKADPDLVTEQEEMVIDLCHGLTRCLELCMMILRPKLHRDTDSMTVGASDDVPEYTEGDFKMAQLAVEEFERDLKNQPKSDRIAQQLRRLLYEEEDAKDQSCLRDLLGSDPRVDKTRIEDTKGGLLPSSYNWILEDHDFQRWREDEKNRPFWITGAPGKGKTMMLCGIINELSEESETNVTYFFCQGTDKRINTGTAALRGLLFLLCKQQHSLISHIREKYDDAGGKLFEDTNAWYALSAIFDNILGDSGLRHTYLIVDALDEFLDDSRQLFVKLIIRMSNSHPKVKWIVSSRDLDGFDMHLRNATYLSLESRAKSVSRAVNAYIEFKMTMLGQQDLGLSEMKKIADELRQKSEGTFLWVAIVCKELESTQKHNIQRVLHQMPKGLGKLYGKLIEDIDQLDWDDPEYCKSLLQTVAVAFRPLTLKELRELADLPQTVPVDAITKMCRSLLTVRDDTVFFVHKSAKDYVSAKWNSGIRDRHESMFSRSVEAMERILQQDIYHLRHPGISIEDIQRPTLDPLAPIRYSCAYWMTHLREAQSYFAKDQVDTFLKVHFLHWFEALSLIRSSSAGVHALRDLVTLSNQEPRFEPLLPLARDMYRFAQYHGAIIAKAPLQVYASALIFSPTCSLTRMLFASKEPDWIVQKPRVEHNWSSCLKTLVSGARDVNSVAFSPNGHHIFSGSSEGTIYIWDAETGVETFRLRGHTQTVLSVAFSGDGKSITSMSAYGTIKTWDAETGACISTREPTFTVSPYNRRRATCLSTGDICLMNSVNNAGGLILSGHSKRVRSVDFSRDGRLIASGSDDKTVKIWDVITGVEISTLHGHIWEVRSVRFSPSAHRLVSGSRDGTIKIWDVESGTEMSTFQGHIREVCSVCFSPDAHRIVSGSRDGTIKIWDVESSIEMETLQGHYGHSVHVNSVALTLDGRRIASASRDKTVKMWDVETGDDIREIVYEYEICLVMFSPDGRHIAAGNSEGRFIISDADSGAPISICSGPDNSDGPVALSLHGRYFAALWNNIIMIKEAESNKYIVALHGHSNVVVSLSFSPKDCHIVASASHDNTIKVWNVLIGAEISTLNMVTEVQLLRFDPTGAFLYALVNAASILPYRHSVWSLTSTSSQTEIVITRLVKHGYGVTVDCSWITWHGQKILWIPHEFRAPHMPQKYDSLPHIILSGCPSGGVWWVAFSSNHHPFTL